MRSRCSLSNRAFLHSMTSTEINGDDRLSRIDRLRYIVRNIHAALTARDGRVQRFFGTPTSDPVRSSPSRFATEQFYLGQLERLPKRRTAVVEIGCGAGHMVRRLEAIDISGTYTGIDIDTRRFQATSTAAFDVHFVNTPIADFVPTEPIDLLLSFSALEHIPCDGVELARLQTCMSPGAIQIHAVPTRGAIFLYLWHGYRQYSVEALRQRFGSAAEIIKIGGMGSFLVHLGFITIPENLLRLSIRSKLPLVYDKACRLGFRVDRYLRFGASAAVVVVNRPRIDDHGSD
jgi:SAM-dependent methyltransferase